MSESKGFSPHVENAVIALESAKRLVNTILGHPRGDDYYTAFLVKITEEINEAIFQLEKTPADSYRSRYQEELQDLKDNYWNRHKNKIMAIKHLRELRKIYAMPNDGLKDCKDEVESWPDPNEIPF